MKKGFSASWLAAAAVVAATYFYFLIFAEFAFLELARHVAPETCRLRWLMLGLGGGGLAGAAFASALFRTMRMRAWLTWTFRACAMAALFALGARGFAGVLAAGLAVGLSLGALTVVVAASLRAATGASRLGVCIGLGTGLAYGACNLPWLFRASPATQTLVAAAVVAAASFLPRWLSVAEAPVSPEREYAPRSLVRWLAILLALVWMDSAAFYIVQHTPALQAATWGTKAALLTNAAVHLVAAVVAGLWVDRGGRAVVTALAVAALAAACLSLDGALPGSLPAGWFYTAGVSLYSTVLVEYPARSGRPWIAGLVFGLAGWIGSGLGIGMAQDLARVPAGFVAAAVAAVLLGLGGRIRWRRGVAVVLAVVGGAFNARADDFAAAIARGREVYIAEGCIHCHSQYVRPKTPADVELWGPATPLREALTAAPPLFGTRRQGPDLSHVGNRRSPEWNRLHLMSPQAVSPGSRMPSYKYLFGNTDARGEALVAYLGSLGVETARERQAQVAQWRPDTRDAIAPEAARGLFLRLCAQCHGTNGGGDGPLARHLSVAPPDWKVTPFRHVPQAEDREAAVSRIIKFGLPGLPMAGHEYLPDREIVGLARHVERLHKAGDVSSSAAVQP